MKAVVLHEYGGPSKLKYEDFPDPVAGEGEVLVRVRGYQRESGGLQDAIGRGEGTLSGGVSRGDRSGCGWYCSGCGA